jgi:hypothetical protein
MRRQRFGRTVAITLGVVLPGLAQAQVAPRAADLVGTWEATVSRNLSTAATDSVARHAVHWLQFSREHWTIIEMKRDRAVLSRTAQATLPPAEQHRANYAKVWNEQHEQVFAARGGRYRVDDGAVYLATAVALQPRNVGRTDTLAVVRLSGTQLVLRAGPDGEGNRWEYWYRRID